MNINNPAHWSLASGILKHSRILTNKYWHLKSE